jgi:hypothetical protein
MANQKVSDLTVLSAATSDDLLYIVDDPASTSTSRKITVGDMQTSLGIAGLTTGSVLFADGSGNVGEDNSNFFWDDTNNRLAVGTTTPKAAMDVVTGAAGFVPPSYLPGTNLSLENNFQAILQFMTPNNGINSIYFGDADSQLAANMTYAHTSGAMTFSSESSYSWTVSGGNSALDISSTSDITIYGDFISSVSDTLTQWGTSSALINSSADRELYFNWYARQTSGTAQAAPITFEGGSIYNTAWNPDNPGQGAKWILEGAQNVAGQGWLGGNFVARGGSYFAGAVEAVAGEIKLYGAASSASTGSPHVFGGRVEINPGFRANGATVNYIHINGTRGTTVFGDNTTTHEDVALMEMNSTTLGFLPPRMTTAQRDVISVAATDEGLVIHNTDTKFMEYYDDTNWQAIGNVKAIINKVVGDSPYTATHDDQTITCDATSGNITVNLPAASSSTGLVLTIKKIDSSANTVTVDGNASETIDDSTIQVISDQYTSITVHCNGTEWYII